jgi:predicted HicB family RNase H-like nuclease
MSADWGGRPSKKKSAPAIGDAAALDAFVQPEKNVATKRLNLNIPAELHRRVKTHCASKGIDMTQAIIQLLEKHLTE